MGEHKMTAHEFNNGKPKRIVLITGASSGIGEALAEEYAADGWDLVLSARRQDKLEEVASLLREKYGASAAVIACDLNNPAGPEKLFREVKDQGIKLDALVNNAGLGYFCVLEELPLKDAHNMLNVNITALVTLTGLFLPDLLEKRGHIVNVASNAAFQAVPYMAVYAATKAFVLSYSEAIAYELKNSGVKVTAFCPGATASGFQETARMNCSSLVKGKKLPPAQEVAAAGYKAIKQGKGLYIHGWLNQLQVYGIRFSPRKLVTKIAAATIKPVDKS